MPPVRDLPEGDGGVSGGLPEHPAEEVGGHEMGAGAGGQVAAPGEELHGFEVDLLIPPVGIFHRGPAFGKGGGV